MVWNDKYCLGVEHIDQQHKGLFTAVNRILRILDEGDAGRGRRTSEEAVKYLKTYTLRHFADEEAYQLEIGYEGFSAHKAQHDAFVNAVLAAEENLQKNNYDRDSVRQLADLASAWLVEHIMQSDQAIVPGPRNAEG